MFDSIKATVSGDDSEEREESGENSHSEWGSRTGPDTLPPGSDATVTGVSASSAQLLSEGEGRFGEEDRKSVV